MIKSVAFVFGATAVSFLLGRFAGARRARRRAKEEINKLEVLYYQSVESSKRDELTLLYSRRSFEESLKDAFKTAIDNSSMFSVLYVTLDGFKTINDLYGYKTGDAVLIEVAHRLSATSRPQDVVARVGSDEFAVLIFQNGDAESAAHFILEKLKDDVHISGVPGKSVPVTIRVGAASFPDGINSWGSVVGIMQEASRRARISGSSRVFFYHPSPDNLMQVAYSRTMLISAINARQIVAAFQPIVDRDGDCVSIEALARLIDEETGYPVPADAFIHSAEKYGLAHLIDMAVISDGLRRIAANKAPNGDHPVIFFNLSASAFLNKDWLLSIPVMARQHGIEPSKLVLEITEREPLHNIEDVIGNINELRKSGIRFALDDFGSGYSSFMYLRKLSPDFVKIEGALVQDVANNEDAKTMVQVIAAIAGHFNADVVAEYVESKAISDVVTAIGIEYQQGRYHGMPSIYKNTLHTEYDDDGHLRTARAA